jgi:hypothetical protein
MVLIACICKTEVVNLIRTCLDAIVIEKKNNTANIFVYIKNTLYFVISLMEIFINKSFTTVLIKKILFMPIIFN